MPEAAFRLGGKVHLHESRASHMRRQRDSASRGWGVVDSYDTEASMPRVENTREMDWRDETQHEKEVIRATSPPLLESGALTLMSLKGAVEYLEGWAEPCRGRCRIFK